MAQVNNKSEVWGWNNTLPEPFKSLPGKKVISSSTHNTIDVNSGFGQGMSTLIPSIIKAVHEYADIMEDAIEGAIGEDGDLNYVERHSTTDINKVHLVSYDSTSGSFKAGVYDMITKSSDPYSILKNYKGTDGTALWVSMMPTILEDEEAAETFALYFTNKAKGESTEELSLYMGTLCDNIYRRVIDKKLLMNIPENTYLAKVANQAIDTGKFAPKNVLGGKFQILPVGQPFMYASMEELTIKANEFTLPLSRTLTALEKNSIFVPPATHKISPEEIRICKEVSRCWTKANDLKVGNILLEGAAGSGKTRLAKVLSYRFGIPYTKVTCSAGMDTDSLIGSILPVLDNMDSSEFSETDRILLNKIYDTKESESVMETIEEALGLPSHLEMYYNPNESWEKITGEKKADVDPVVCLDKANAIATAEWRRLIKLVKSSKAVDDNNVEYRYYPSEIVRAFQFGYLLEIQEPTMIRDAGLLTVLNSALEMDGSINLPTGVIQRHPDFICVATTNRGYAGCKPLNESFRDRFQHAEKMDIPSREVMIQRAVSITGTANIAFVASLCDAIRALDEAAFKNSIKGVAGMRSLFYCLDAVNDGMNVKDALYQKIIYKMTTDEDEIAILELAVEEGSDLLINTERII